MIPQFIPSYSGPNFGEYYTPTAFYILPVVAKMDRINVKVQRLFDLGNVPVRNATQQFIDKLRKFGLKKWGVQCGGNFARQETMEFA